MKYSRYRIRCRVQYPEMYFVYLLTIWNLSNSAPHHSPENSKGDGDKAWKVNIQPFRGQHLDVTLWEAVPQKDLGGGCRRDAVGLCFRVQAQGG